MTEERKPRQRGRAVPVEDKAPGIESRIRARIEELKQEQTAFFQEAHAKLAAYTAAIAELERALQKEASPSPQHSDGAPSH